MDGFLSPGPRRLIVPTLGLLLVAACGSAGNDDRDAPGAGGPLDDPSSVAGGDINRPRVAQAWVIFGPDTVVAEVARTPAEREQGLMGRQDVPDGTGMLFVFESEGIRSFWMKDTPVALDIAYLNADLRIVTIHQMEPLVTSTYDSTEPAMFALEVRQGWLAEHGIEVGDVAEVVFGG
jgi:hypothetical protein